MLIKFQKSILGRGLIGIKSFKVIVSHELIRIKTSETEFNQIKNESHPCLMVGTGRVGSGRDGSGSWVA